METVEIVCRCKDCGYSQNHKDKEGVYYCHYWGYEWIEDEDLNTVRENDFCSNGEKRTYFKRNCNMKKYKIGGIHASEIKKRKEK